jgi:ABC-type multidrug transport system fused ATPase/permease subunit
VSGSGVTSRTLVVVVVVVVVLVVVVVVMMLIMLVVFTILLTVSVVLSINRSGMHRNAKQRQHKIAIDQQCNRADPPTYDLDSKGACAGGWVAEKRADADTAHGWSRADWSLLERLDGP